MVLAAHGIRRLGSRAAGDAENGGQQKSGFASHDVSFRNGEWIGRMATTPGKARDATDRNNQGVMGLHEWGSAPARLGTSRAARANGAKVTADGKLCVERVIGISSLQVA